jgi:hypothetical protein
MDFIERLLGVSPDGGSGAFELLLLIIPVALMQLRRAVYRWPKNRPQV